MNSLQDLNNFAFTSIEATDSRPAGVIFDRLEVDEYVPITFSDLFYFAIPTGIEISEIINYVQADCTVRFSIISQESDPLTGSELLWGAFPSYITKTTVGTVYTFTGLRSSTDWNAIKSPRWNIPANHASKKEWYVQVDIEYFNQEQNIILKETYFVFDLRYFFLSRMTCNFQSETVPTRIRTLACQMNCSSQLLPIVTGPWGLPEIVYFNSGVSQLINCPSFTDTRLNMLWTVTITPSDVSSIETFTNTSSEGIFAVDSTSKVITIIGTTAQIQDRLDKLYLQTKASIQNTFTLTYDSVDSNSLEFDTEQTLQHINLKFLDNGIARSYDEDVTFTLSGAPAITDLTSSGLDNYTYKVVPATPAAISSMSVSGGSYNSSTKELTIVGNRQTINTKRNQIVIVPAPDYAVNFNLTYTLTTPTAETATKTQVIAITANSAEIENISQTRNYWSNTVNYPFGTTDYKVAQTGLAHTWERTGIARARTGVYSGSINRYRFGTGGLAIAESAVGRVVPPDPFEIGSVRNTAYLKPATNLTFSGNFTFETWFLGSNTNNVAFFDCHNDAVYDPTLNGGAGGYSSYSNNGLAAYLTWDSTPTSSNTLTVWLNGTYRLHITNIPLLQAGIWHHFAIVRNGSTVTVYLNGTARGSFTSSETFTISNTKGIGLGNSKGSYFINGNPDDLTRPWGITLYPALFVDNFRISVAAQYTGNFTPARATVNQFSALVADFDVTVDKTWPPPQASSYGGLPLQSTQTTPQIVDVDATNPTYTIEFACASSFGTFGTGSGDQTNNYSFTGTKAQCNAKFSQIQFRPTGSTSSTITYTQKKNGNTQLIQTIPFSGFVGVAV